MTRPTEAFREEHQHLLVHVDQIRVAAGEVRDLAVEEREAVVGRVLDFLRDTLLPHAEWEEQVLYTAVGELLGDAKAMHALITVHFEKVEEIYLPLLDARPDVAERVMKQIGAEPI